MNRKEALEFAVKILRSPATDCEHCEFGGTVCDMQCENAADMLEVIARES